MARLSQRIIESLRGYCERIHVAGSIRRGRPYPNDIDIVLIPRAGMESEMRARIFERTTPISDGPKNLICRLRDGTQLDVFFAHAGTHDLLTHEPTNWGSVLLCRTGSKDHNIKLASRARELGLKWETMRGIVGPDGKVLASATEQEIFECLKMDYVEPANRE
jgi:DNA polymerase/3'-5' exonuclease PolX